MYWTVAFILFLNIASISNLLAEEDSIDDPMAAMMQLLNVETELATKSKLNADYVPGMVTVLYARDLEAMGFQLVWEALSLVPGMTNVSNSVGAFGINVRGVGPVFGSGKLLYLINGRHSELLFGATGPAPALQLGIVDRIEVIRGPGSSVYGGYAYNGVINVILKKGNGGSLRASNQKKYSGELFFDTANESPFQANVSIAGETFAGSKTRTGTDLMYQMGNAANSYAPGIRNDKVGYGTLNMDASWKGFALHGLHTRTRSQDFFGINNTLSQPNKAGYFIFNQANYYLDKTWEWNDQSLLFRVGHQRMNLYEKTPIVPTGFTTIVPLPVVGNTVVKYPDGMVQQLHYTEEKEMFELEWQGNIHQDHQLLLGFNAAYAKTKDAWFGTNYDLATRLPFNATTFITTGVITPIGIQYHTGANNWIKENIRRNEQSLFIQDLWQLSDAFTATLGFRYDRFSDVGSNASPRLAAVYSLNDRHIFKAQFATAFRPPTFLELYLKNNLGFLQGNSQLKPETSRNIDVSYIFKGNATTLRTSFYYAEMKNLIITDLNNRYGNIGHANRKGVEFEYEFIAHQDVKIDGNLSYGITRDESSNTPIISSSRWLANSHLIYQLNNDFNIQLLSQYIGKRARKSIDPRSQGPSTTLWTISLKHEDFLMQGITATLGLRNVFDRPVTFPSTMTQVGGVAVQTYPNDYPQNGRRAWLQLAYVH